MSVSTTMHDGGLVEIVVEGAKGNVLDAAHMMGLGDAFRRAAERDDARVVLLRANGRDFSFGASIEEHRPAEAPKMLATFHALIRTIALHPIPVVALVQGRCLGGAFETVLACHLVLATKSTRFACPEIKLAVLPPVLAALGPIRLGAPTAERLLLTGAELDATRAEQIGFVAEIAPEDAEPRAWALDFCTKTFGALSPFALRQGVIAARRGAGIQTAVTTALDAVERQYIDAIVPSHDGTEGIASFLERRSPTWKNA